MRSQSDTRRSTSALLYDENAETIDAILDQKPLLGYTDLIELDKHEPWYRRIYSRHGLLMNCRFHFHLLSFQWSLDGRFSVSFVCIFFV